MMARKRGARMMDEETYSQCPICGLVFLDDEVTICDLLSL